MPKKIAVIDGNSLMHRAYHAVPQTMNAPDGRPTNAVFGFIAMLLKFIDIASPDALICAFDAGRPAFRMEALEQYKAQRPPMDDDLKVQFPIVEELLEAMNVPVVRIKGWEGDDVLGTIAARDEELGYETLLVTGDKDAYQLATDKTRIVTTKKGITDVAIYGPAEVLERYGVRPDQFIDFLGLKGDSSDNIPGVPGIGDKTAAKLLQTYGNLEGIYEHVDDLKGKQKEKIVDNKDMAYLSREVATIVRDLDFPLDLEACSFPSFDSDKVTEAFKSVQFNAHLSRVLKLVGKELEKKAAPLVVEPVVSGRGAGARRRGHRARRDGGRGVHRARAGVAVQRRPARRGEHERGHGGVRGRRGPRGVRAHRARRLVRRARRQARGASHLSRRYGRGRARGGRRAHGHARVRPGAGRLRAELVGVRVLLRRAARRLLRRRAARDEGRGRRRGGPGRGGAHAGAGSPTRSGATRASAPTSTSTCRSWRCSPSSSARAPRWIATA